MAGVAEATMASLGSALVEAHLQSQVSLAGPQLLIRESSLVLVGHLRSQSRSIVFGVQLSLK